MCPDRSIEITDELALRRKDVGRSPHVVIAVDDFTQAHMSRIAEALAGWASWSRVDHADEARYGALVRQSDVVVGWPKAEWLVSSPVRLLQLGSVGWDAYVHKGLEGKPDFTLCNASGVMSAAVAEHMIALMMSLTRRIPQHVHDQQERRWQRQAEYDEVAGSTACLIGVGDIGTDMARRLIGLGVHVIGVRKRSSEPHEVIRDIYPLSRLKEAVARADHVILIVPETADTRLCFTSDVFAAMKAGSYFYNLARGGLVEEPALIEALRSGRLAGAGLDVFTHEPLPQQSPLWDMEHVIITPHAGGRSVKEFGRFCSLVVNNLQRYQQGAPFLNAVSLQ